MLFKNFFTLLVFTSIFSTISSQYYTKVQLTNINNLKTAAEGDMYLDTINNNYYIGITTGELAHIGNIDSVTFSNDTLRIYKGNSITVTQLVNNNSPWRNSDGTAASDTSTSINFMNGNVGIGTTSPLSKLHIIGNIGHSGSILSRGSTYSNIWMRFDEHQYGNSTIIGAGGLTIIGSGEFANTAKPNFSVGTEDLILGGDNGVKLIVNTQPGGWASKIEAMTVLNTGNIGVGVTNPSIKLDVAGKSQNQNARNSVSISTFITTTSTSFVDVPGMSITITTANSDILILAGIPGIMNSGTDASVNFRILVDGIQSGSIVEHENSATGIIWSSSLHALSNVAAGTHTIKLQWSVQSGTGSINSGNSVLKGPRTLSVVEL